MEGRGFANSDNDAPLGSFVAVENTKEGFEVHGFLFTPQGDANHFTGMGIPWKKNRIMYFFEGLFRNRAEERCRISRIRQRRGWETRSLRWYVL